MQVVGLTGGVGMGKSVVAEILRTRGEEIIDTDLLARELVEPGTEGLEEIATEFGRSIIGSDGRLDRAALSREVFKDESRRKILEGILHPRIRRRWKQQIETARQVGKARVVVVIPLLFETGAQVELSRTVCVGCSPGVQMTRLKKRGWTEDEAQKRMAAQWPVNRKMDLADGVIWNESSLKVCAQQAVKLFE